MPTKPNIRTFMFTGQLRNRAHPSTLRLGDLSVANDCHHLPGDPALREVPGRTEFGSVFASPISGLFHAPFDSGASVLVAKTINGLFEADEGETGTWSKMTTDPTRLSQSTRASTLVHFDSSFVFLDGSSPNQVLTPSNVGDNETGSRTTIRHGLEYQQTGMEVKASGGGNWHANLETGKYYWYWWTEYDSDEDVESGVDFTEAPMQSILVSSATNVPKITRNAFTNPSADKWRLYRATGTANEEDTVSAASGQLVVEVDRTVETITDTRTDGQPIEGSSLPGGHGWFSGSVMWENPNAVKTATTADVAVARGGSIHYNYWDAFGFSSVTAPVGNILVTINARYTGTERDGYGESVHISVGYDGDFGSSYQLELTTTFHEYEVPRQFVSFGDWNREWTIAEVNSSDFQVTLKAGPRAGNTVEVAYFTVTVFHGGEDRVEIGKDFATTVILAPNGETQEVSRNGPPPRAQIGENFDGSLCLAGVAGSKDTLYYSAPGELHYFPSVYTIPIRTKERDEITALVRKDSALIVGLKKHLARITRLPSDTDTTYDSQRYEIYDTEHGIVGPHAATSVSLPGRGQLVAFIDADEGLMLTDGFRSFPATDGLDWAAMTNSSMLERSVLLSYPKWRALILYYASAGSGEINKRLIFHYDLDGNLLARGPCHLPLGVGAAVAARRGSQINHFYGSMGGMVFLEDRGFDLGGAETDGFKWRTGEIGQAGLDQRVQRVYVHYSDHLSLTPMKFRLLTTEVGGEQEAVVDDERTITLGSGYVRWDPDTSVDNFMIEGSHSGAGSPAAVDHVTYLIEPGALED